jgi:hypothetical protein
MAILDKMSILRAPDLKKETVYVPEWGKGAEVIVQEMSALDRDLLQAEIGVVEFVDGPEGEDGKPVRKIKNTAALTNYAARVLVRCIVCEDGGRMFCDEEAEALGKKSVAAINRLFAVAQRLNGGTDSKAVIKN